MAEWTVDLICKKLSIDAVCTTAQTPLPGSQQVATEGGKRKMPKGNLGKASAFYRHGEKAEKIDDSTAAKRALVCECEQVTVGEVEYAVSELNVNNLVDLRRRTRMGMGTCQGELCACRAAAVMASVGKSCADKAKADLKKIYDLGLQNLAICMAKTQKSLSDNPALLGRPKDFIITVREIEIAAGAGFLIPITGEIMRMPGLPETPASEAMDITADGEITGLF
jgi:glycerol-3-phosphate dehydrogenase